MSLWQTRRHIVCKSMWCKFASAFHFYVLTFFSLRAHFGLWWNQCNKFIVVSTSTLNANYMHSAEWISNLNISRFSAWMNTLFGCVCNLYMDVDFFLSSLLISSKGCRLVFTLQVLISRGNHLFPIEFVFRSKREKKKKRIPEWCGRRKRKNCTVYAQWQNFSV